MQEERKESRRKERRMKGKGGRYEGVSLSQTELQRVTEVNKQERKIVCACVCVCLSVFVCVCVCVCV